MQSIKTLVNKKEYSVLQELFDIYKKIDEWSVKNNAVIPCESDINNIYLNACTDGNIKLAEMIIQSKFQIDVYMSRDAIKELAKKGHLPIVDLLTSYDPTLCAFALQPACEYKQYPVIHRVIEHMQNNHKCNFDYKYGLFGACMADDLNLVQYIMSFCDVDDNVLVQAFFKSLEVSKIDTDSKSKFLITEYLFNLNPSAIAYHMHRILETVCENGNFSTIKMMVDYTKDTDSKLLYSLLPNLCATFCIQANVDALRYCNSLCTLYSHYSTMLDKKRHQFEYFYSNLHLKRNTKTKQSICNMTTYFLVECKLNLLLFPSYRHRYYFETSKNYVYFYGTLIEHMGESIVYKTIGCDSPMFANYGYSMFVSNSRDVLKVYNDKKQACTRILNNLLIQDILSYVLLPYVRYENKSHSM